MSVSAQQHLNVTWASLTRPECMEWGGQLVGSACEYVPDITLMSFILFFGTYTCSMGLKKFKTSCFFPTMVHKHTHTHTHTHTRHQHSLMRILIDLCFTHEDIPPHRTRKLCPHTHTQAVSFNLKLIASELKRYFGLAAVMENIPSLIRPKIL